MIGTFHGDGQEGPRLVRQYVDRFAGDASLSSAYRLTAVIDANPDGTARGTRANANGVDINRNFPASNWKSFSDANRGGSGSSPASESETSAIVAAIGSASPSRVLVAYSTRTQPLNNYDGPASGIARAMSAKNGYTVTDNVGYATPGSFGSWYGLDKGKPVLSLELPRGQSASSIFSANAGALDAFVRS
jgi:hypothetical protein